MKMMKKTKEVTLKDGRKITILEGEEKMLSRLGKLKERKSQPQTKERKSQSQTKGRKAKPKVISKENLKSGD